MLIDYIDSILVDQNPSSIINFIHETSVITRPNCELDRRTVLRLNVPGFHRQTFKHVPKCLWIPLSKLPWTPHSNTCNVNFTRKTCKRIPQTVCGFRILLFTELACEQLKARA